MYCTNRWRLNCNCKYQILLIFFLPIFFLIFALIRHWSTRVLYSLSGFFAVTLLAVQSPSRQECQDNSSVPPDWIVPLHTKMTVFWRWKWIAFRSNSNNFIRIKANRSLENWNKRRMRLFPNFTCHNLITHNNKQWLHLNTSNIYTPFSNYTKKVSNFSTLSKFMSSYPKKINRCNDKIFKLILSANHGHTPSANQRHLFGRLFSPPLLQIPQLWALGDGQQLPQSLLWRDRHQTFQTWILFRIGRGRNG